MWTDTTTFAVEAGLMPANESLFDVEQHGKIGVISLRPYQGAVLADGSFSQQIIEATKKLESDGKSVLLVCVPAGNLAAERMEEFWKTARETPPDQRSLAGRYAPVTNLPLSVLRQETAVQQVLETLQSTSLFKIISVEGNIDFDLLGLLLGFEIRFCSRETVFQNHILDRGTGPGFGVVWFLARQLGLPTTTDLVLHHRNLSAETAHGLKLITHLSDSGACAADARQYAEEVANAPPAVLKALVQAANCLQGDFQKYLKLVGGGFTGVPQ
jgi:hypothetical protein